MIFGDCPYCDGPTGTPIANTRNMPCYTKETCPSCGKEYWLKHSRWDPVAYPLDHPDVKDLKHAGKEDP